MSFWYGLPDPLLMLTCPRLSFSRSARVELRCSRASFALTRCALAGNCDSGTPMLSIGVEPTTRAVGNATATIWSSANAGE